MALTKLNSRDDGENKIRLVTGCVDGQVRVWKRTDNLSAVVDTEEEASSAKNEQVFTYIGTISPPSNISTMVNNEGISSVHFHQGKYLGICRSNDKVIELYASRTEVEVQKKRKRRLQRRREKMNAAANSDKEKGAKRGILDDPESE